MKNRISNTIAEVSLPIFLTTYLKTIKIEISGDDKRNKKAIFIFWHKNMLIGWNLFKNKGYSALVSQSKDGQILSNILYKWNYDIVRGSSSKGGKEAIDTIINSKNVNSIVITPDGPRGPSMEIKNGPLILSNKTSLPIIPVNINYLNKRVLKKSWDKFEVPLPFSKCIISFGDEFFYKEYLPEDELKMFKNSLKAQM